MHSLFFPFHLIILGDCRFKVYGGTLKQGVGSFKEVQISLSRDIFRVEKLSKPILFQFSIQGVLNWVLRRYRLMQRYSFISNIRPIYVWSF